MDKNSFALLEAGDENGDDVVQLVKAAKVAAAKAQPEEAKPAAKPGEADYLFWVNCAGHNLDPKFISPCSSCQAG
jgi:hypothetical protein